jgi:hypothetical protein
LSFDERSIVWILIGTLVHRAVLWPMIRPLIGRQLDVFKDAGFLVDRATTAMAVLERCLRPLVTGGTDADRDLALSVMNLEGPWDTESFVAAWDLLGEPARREVFRGLDRVVENAATAVSNFIRSVSISGARVSCAWSEVPLFAADGLLRVEDSGELRLRADLIVWRERGEVDVLELKVGSLAPPADAHKRNLQQVERYVDEVRSRVGPESRVRGTLLYVGRERDGSELHRV